MKVVKPTITMDPAGIWHARVIPCPGMLGQHFLSSQSGKTPQEAYRAWVDAASREPWHYGVGGLDMAYHREQVQQMEANVGFRDKPNTVVLDHVGNADHGDLEDDEGESNYLDDRLDAVQLMRCWPTALSDEQVERVEGLFADMYQVELPKDHPYYRVILDSKPLDWSSGCSGQFVRSADHLDHEIASLVSQGLLPPPAPIEMRD